MKSTNIGERKDTKFYFPKFPPNFLYRISALFSTEWRNIYLISLTFFCWWRDSQKCWPSRWMPTVVKWCHVRLLVHLSIPFHFMYFWNTVLLAFFYQNCLFFLIGMLYTRGNQLVVKRNRTSIPLRLRKSLKAFKDMMMTEAVEVIGVSNGTTFNISNNKLDPIAFGGHQANTAVSFQMLFGPF